MQSNTNADTGANAESHLYMSFEQKMEKLIHFYKKKAPAAACTAPSAADGSFPDARRNTLPQTKSGAPAIHGQPINITNADANIAHINTSAVNADDVVFAARPEKACRELQRLFNQRNKKK
jgi:hypothetical protein